MDNLDYLFTYLSEYYGKKLYERETLFIFDEIQLCPRARGAIKHLVADGRYDYIETGSLISIKKNVKDILIPSEEEKIKMYPFDFEEFLWAMGNDTIMDFIEAMETYEYDGHNLQKNILSDYIKNYKWYKQNKEAFENKK